MDRFGKPKTKKQPLFVPSKKYLTPLEIPTKLRKPTERSNI